jgi:hypothetical protein
VRAGLQIELKFSSILHEQMIPLLISDRVLRSRGCGQIDVAGMNNNSITPKITIYELKTKQYPSRKQLTRLRKSQQFLATIFDCEVQLQLFRWQMDHP